MARKGRPSSREPEVVELDEMAVVEGAQHGGLALEALQDDLAVLVGGGLDELDHRAPLHAELVGEIDGPEAAVADLLHDLVLAENGGADESIGRAVVFVGVAEATAQLRRLGEPLLLFPPTGRRTCAVGAVPCTPSPAGAGRDGLRGGGLAGIVRALPLQSGTPKPSADQLPA
jgi:hypothetical protein